MDSKRKIRWSALHIPPLLLCTVWCNGQQATTNVTKSAVSTTALADAHSAVTPTQYTIGSGDVLNVQVWKEKDLSQVVVVRPDGKISLPLLGDLQVIGKEPSQVEEIVQTRLQSMVVEPRVTVTVSEIHSRMVYITGEVARPGAYPLNTPITVLQLIAQAGGLTEFASRKKIQVIRSNSKRDEHLLSYKAMTQSKDGGNNLTLSPGDTVVIP
ncbi:polysaccharide biosynthesis/export family protein [Terriglobus sp. RCC_193]|uniref:polysaccharide biosynthesis/export family protein n=1 Tax=Terriglobus sp. RCC_193 TaxID=3239218 RepID=UPI0035232D3C